MLALLLTALAGELAGQSVAWQPGAGSLAFGQVSQLQLVFENCKPDGNPTLPRVDGLEIQYSGSGSSFTMENMSITRKEVLSYSVRPTKRPEVRIPAFEVATNKGTLRVPAATYSVGNATIGQSAVPLSQVARATLTPADGAFWAGEVFPITYKLDIAQRYRPRQPGPINWNPAPLTTEDWGQPQQFESQSGGEARIGLIYKTRGYIGKPGTYTISSTSQDIVLLVGSSGNAFSFPFSSPEMVQQTVTSNRPRLTIKPLPDGAPPSFSGAVGQFTFTAKVVPTSVSVGEPITWTLDLSGTGNWPDISSLPARELSRDFKVLQPQARRTPAKGKLFEGSLTEDAVLIPTKPGSYTLAPVTYTYFDPDSGTYQTVKTKAVTVTITPLNSSELASQPLLAPPAGAAGGSAAASPGTQLAAPPSAPAAIPRDPLPGAEFGLVPLSTHGVSFWLLVSVLWLVPAWLLLAAWRSRQTDPQRARRLARGRLFQTLQHLGETAVGPARHEALHAWQRDAAVLLGIDHAAPHPAMLAGRIQSPSNQPASDGDLDHWIRLWTEADRTLYGERGELPVDWTVRAEAALQATRVPGWQPATLFKLGNLMPWFRATPVRAPRHEAGKVISTLTMLLVLACLWHPARAAAAGPAPAAPPGSLQAYSSPLAAYRAGNFAAAEQAWRAAIARHPTDWVAHHNLALALAQQDQWPEAAAHWTSAFLLDPRNESVRWHLALGYERAGYTPPDLGEFADASGPHLLARLASPAEWQWLLVIAGAVFSLGLLLLLLRAYRRPARWMRPAAFSGLGAGLLLALLALLSLHFYGIAGNPRSAMAWHQVLLRSIPTEADTQQKTSALPAGSIGVVDKTFLGWVQLAFPNGQTGWVRRDDIVWLYR